MSQRNARREKRPRRNGKRRIGWMPVLGVILSLSVAGGIIARWGSGTGTKQAAAFAPAPQPLAAAAMPSPTPAALIAKDYIYADGRLVATEARESTSALSNGIVEEPDDSPTPPPVVYTDMAVWRPSNGTWYVLNAVDGTLTAQMWGMAGDKPVPGDYDGDGKLDFAVYRPANSVWYILRSSDGGVDGPQWGVAGDETVPGDYDGDGKTDVAVRRGSTFYIMKSSDGVMLTQQWGNAADLAVPADYDGDGKTDITTFRPSDATWSILKSSNPEDEATSIMQQWGANSDLPLIGDYDGDVIADFATFRPSDTVWRILQSFDNLNIIQQWGLTTDKPAPGDYDGDGRMDIAVVRPRVSAADNHSTWYILKSSDGQLMSAQWGLDGDVAVPGKYNRVSQAACANCQ
jgi:hypothetical protein